MHGDHMAALALRLPTLGARDVRQIGPGAPVAHAPLALIGPGDGLGVSGLVPLPGGGHVAIAGEGGHVTLASCDAEEAAVLGALHRVYGHVSAERVLSEPGLQNLYRACCSLLHAPPLDDSAAAITARARHGADAASTKAARMFCGLLGQVAGNLALTLGAQGGVYIGGGIVPRLGAWFESSPFRERFESKGRFRDYLRAMPTYVLRRPH
jgi:glucokinase